MLKHIPLGDFNSGRGGRNRIGEVAAVPLGVVLVTAGQEHA